MNPGIGFARCTKVEVIAGHYRMLTQVFTGGSVWLKQWSEANDVAGANPNVTFYIMVYFAFGIGSAVLVVLQTLILWIFCSIEVSGGIPGFYFGDVQVIPAPSRVAAQANAGRAHESAC